MKSRENHPLSQVKCASTKTRRRHTIQRYSYPVLLLAPALVKELGTTGTARFRPVAASAWTSITVRRLVRSTGIPATADRSRTARGVIAMTFFTNSWLWTRQLGCCMPMQSTTQLAGSPCVRKQSFCLPPFLHCVLKCVSFPTPDWFKTNRRPADKQTPRSLSGQPAVHRCQSRPRDSTALAAAVRAGKTGSVYGRPSRLDRIDV